MSRTFRWFSTILAGLVLVGALASCGDKDQAGSRDESSASESSSGASPDDDGEESSSASDGDESSADAGVKTLTGKVSAGVEKGCLMLDADGEKYQLIGDKARKLKAGMKVEVTGRVSDKAMTTCMEGTVFEVETVKTL